MPQHGCNYERSRRRTDGRDEDTSRVISAGQVGEWPGRGNLRPGKCRNSRRAGLTHHGERHIRLEGAVKQGQDLSHEPHDSVSVWTPLVVRGPDEQETSSIGERRGRRRGLDTMAYGYHGRAARSLEGLAVLIRHADDDVGGPGEMDFGVETLLTSGDGLAAQTFRSVSRCVKIASAS